ncbi:MAG: hypothetical protein V2A56_13420 [bacterium]
MQRDNVLHGFHLTEMRGDGNPSTLEFAVLPDHILDFAPRTPNGSTITYRLLASGEGDTCDVVESVKEIEKLIRHRRMLDQQNQPVGRALKGGKPIA